jgi:hypothetical protein
MRFSIFLSRSQNRINREIAIAAIAIANLTKKSSKSMFSERDKTIAIYAAIKPNCGVIAQHYFTSL